MAINPEYFFTLIPFLIGTAFTLIGWLNLLRKHKMSKKVVLINSYINNIKHETTSTSLDSPSTMSYVYVTYVFNGQQYIRNIFYNQRNMKVGDLVELYCDPNNPKNVTTKKVALEFIVFSIIDPIIILIGFLILFLMMVCGL